MTDQKPSIKLILGLGNYGKKFENTRHNIGFKVVDELAQKHHAQWQLKNNMEFTEITTEGGSVTLVKPHTYMNNSGEILPPFFKKGIKPEQILVVHDELEKKFGTLALRLGGSARGHNGLKSIIQRCGEQFWRLRCGIGRPENKEDVPDYVLQPFSESSRDVTSLIEQATELIEKTLS